DAVSIPVSGQSGIALLADYCLLEKSNVRLDRLGINTREQRVDFLPDRDKRNAVFLKDSSKNSAAGTIHRVDGELEPALGDEVQIGETANRSNVGRFE